MSVKSFYIPYYSFVTVVYLCLFIPAIIIPIENLDLNCTITNSTILTLQDWMIMEGITHLVFLIVIWTGLVASIQKDLNYDTFNFLNRIYTWPFLVFFFSWAIVGAVVLWEDSKYCPKVPFYKFSMALVIIELINCFVLLNSKDED